MPVYRTPDGRIVEERTTLTPPAARPGQEAGGTAAGGDDATAGRRGGGPAPETGRRRAGYADPTVVRRPAAPAGGRPGRDEERTRLAGAVPTDSTRRIARVRVATCIVLGVACDSALGQPGASTLDEDYPDAAAFMQRVARAGDGRFVRSDENASLSVTILQAIFDG